MQKMKTWSKSPFLGPFWPPPFFLQVFGPEGRKTSQNGRKMGVFWPVFSKKRARNCSKGGGTLFPPAGPPKKGSPPLLSSCGALFGPQLLKRGGDFKTRFWTQKPHFLAIFWCFLAGREKSGFRGPKMVKNGRFLVIFVGVAKSGQKMMIKIDMMMIKIMKWW